MVAFDTDLIGPYGFCADLSRSWLAGDGSPLPEQGELYRIAADQIAANVALLAARNGFRELSERARNPPPDCFPARYGVLFHGVGLADEYPTLPHHADWTEDSPTACSSRAWWSARKAISGASAAARGSSLRSRC